MSNDSTRPGRIWYLLPVLLALAAIAIIPVAIWRAATDQSITAVQFKAPGGKELEIVHPGTYVLWHETDTIFEGQTYSSPSNLPGGMHFVLAELNTKANAAVPMSQDLGASETIGSTVRHSVGNFMVTEPGKYRISVDGQFPDQIFYFRESLWRQVGRVFHAVALTLVIWAVAAVVALVLFLRRRAVPAL